jgi:hypothetical protein
MDRMRNRGGIEEHGIVPFSSPLSVTHMHFMSQHGGNDHRHCSSSKGTPGLFPLLSSRPPPIAVTPVSVGICRVFSGLFSSFRVFSGLFQGFPGFSGAFRGASGLSGDFGGFLGLFGTWRVVSGPCRDLWGFFGNFQDPSGLSWRVI